MGQRVSLSACDPGVPGNLASPTQTPEAFGAGAKPPAIAKLCFAAAQGDVVSVRRVLASGVPVNAVDYDRRSALHVAASDGHSEVVECLLSAKANVNIVDRWGHTALDDATGAGFVEVRDALIAAGASFGRDLQAARSEPGAPAAEALDAPPASAMQTTTALCCAAAAGSLALVQEIRQAGVDLNGSDYDGRTALHVAAAHGHLELVRWLTSMRAEVNKQDTFGLTPLNEAVRLGHGDVAKALTQLGAESSGLVEVRLQAGTGSWAIPLSEVKIGAVLSTTLKSVIYRATWRGTQVVCKTTGMLKMSTSGTCIDLSKLDPDNSPPPGDDLEAEQELIHEIRLLSTLRHPDLVMFLGACTDHTPPLVISEFMEGGDLERYYMAQARKIGHPYRPPTATLLKWASSVARALAFLHGCSRPIVHRDLKPLNLLMNRNEDVKVTDFGISKLLAQRRPGCENGAIEAPALMSGGVGTWRYMAPEVVRYEQYTDRVDIYSYALILWFMATGRQPFVERFGPDAEVVLKEYLRGREPRPDLAAMKCPAAFRDLTQDCWSASPEKRPSAHECTQRLAALVATENDAGSRKSLKKSLSTVTQFVRQVSR